MNQQASEPFEFQSRLNLTLLTGLKAKDLAQLLENLRTAPGAVVYFHTHHFLVQHQYLSPEPPNDFAYWVSNNLLEQRLGEELAAVDILRFHSIHELRDELIGLGAIAERMLGDEDAQEWMINGPHRIFRDSGERIERITEISFTDDRQLRALIDARRRPPAAAIAVAGFRPADPGPYGRLVEERGGELVRIVEAHEAGPEERAIGLCNGGIRALAARHAFALLDRIGNDNKQREFYLTDIVAIARAEALASRVAELPAEELLGVNTRAELAALVEGDQMAHKAHLPGPLIDWAQIVIAHHFVYDWIAGQWGRIRHKRVIWRTVGQSNPALEEFMATLRPEGLQIVRYSPKERSTPHFAGEDALIRFYKDPDEWQGWTGEDAVVGNVTQDMVGRADACGLAFWQAATEGLPVRPAGPMSELLRGGIGSSLDFNYYRQNIPHQIVLQTASIKGRTRLTALRDSIT